jgi:hypothetical protein
MTPVRLPATEMFVSLMLTLPLVYAAADGTTANQQIFTNKAESPVAIVRPAQAEMEILLDAKTKNWIKFQGLAKQWKAERGAIPSVAAMVSLQSYQRIVGMGRDALPYILGQLRSEGDEPDHWFPALSAIAAESPVPVESRGKLKEMAKAWLKWGQEQGYV